MKKRKMFVFRASHGNDSGNPRGHCPLDYGEAQQIRDPISKDDMELISYDDNDILSFLFHELWHNKSLRQGWGIENLNLLPDVEISDNIKRDRTKKWIEEYLISAKKKWGVNVSCSHAKGRHNILYRMTKIEENDVIFIPKTSDKHKGNDYNRFTVCQAAGSYVWDFNEEKQDFGHCIPVKNLKIFRYSPANLEGTDFGSPYISAVMQVKKHHNRYDKFQSFLDENYF